MYLTKESLNFGSIRRYIYITAESAYGKVSGIFDALTLTNKDKYIFRVHSVRRKNIRTVSLRFENISQCSISVTERADVFELV